MVWNPSLHCSITLIAVFRFMCTGLVFWVFIRHNDTPLVKASGQELCYILLLGVFMSYAMTFLLLAKPSPAICALRRLGLGTSFAVCYSALLTKTNRIARIFNGVKDGVGTVRPRFISPSSQVSRWSRVSMHMQQVVNVYDVDWMSSLWFLGVHLFESHFRAIGYGFGVVAGGGSRNTAFHTAGEAEDCHPQV